MAEPSQPTLVFMTAEKPKNLIVINYDPDCKFVRKLKNARQAAQYEIQSICKSMKPLISLLKQKKGIMKMLSRPC